MATQTLAAQMSEQIEEVTAVLKALAHPLRLSLLCHLLDEDKDVGALVEATGGAQSQVSQFLKALKSEGLVESTREGVHCIYRVSDRRVSKLIRELKGIYCDFPQKNGRASAQERTVK